ncbi:DUF3375 domain-containing protein [Jonesia quinghaiensis]|uniref:DUF3375 domain-containing protein n=1 Tax=Jonesia quinghaiensis TaxID=262806 RepID=UPI0004242CCF|nr:DUF3375 domain-containing protein [Jonesia quinghaiensis]
MQPLTDQLDRARRAFSQPTLTLLNRQYAPTVLALFASVFSAQRTSVGAEQFYVEIEDHLTQLRAHGVADIEASSVRQLTTRWVREKWLIRQVTVDNTEEYSLTSHTQDALDFVARASGMHQLVSESRIRTLLSTIERFAHEAQPDREARITQLDRDIQRLTQERDALRAGAPMPTIEPQRMEEQLDNVRYLVRELPADFARVAESIKDLQRSILSDLRSDSRPAGDVLDEYLDASEQLLHHTPEGRAFTGAVDVLRDETLLNELDQAIDAILSHPHARALDSRDKAALRGIKTSILDSVNVVLTEQQRASRTLTANITHHNPLRDRELDEALRSTVTALTRWFEQSHRGDRVDAMPRFQRAALGRLRTTLADLGATPVPDHLDAPREEVSGMALDDMLALGGPQHEAIHGAFQAALARQEAVTIAQLFAQSSPDLQRPVEILGFQEMALTSKNLQTTETPGEAHQVDTVTAIRHDGTRRQFYIPRHTVGLAQVEHGETP